MPDHSRAERKRREALDSVFGVTKLLADDLIRAAELLRASVEGYRPGGKGPDFDLAFRAKVAVHCLFALVDGSASAMRHAVVDYGPDLGLALPEKTQLLLVEQRRKANGEIVPKWLSPLQGWRMAMQYFPRLFGAHEWSIPLGHHWQALAVLAEVRVEITHGKTLEDLGAKDVWLYWTPAYMWVLTELRGLIDSCVSQLASVEKKAWPAIELAAYTHQPRPTPIFGPEDYDSIRSDVGKSIPYLRACLDPLFGDISRAYDLVNKLPPGQNLLSPAGQFGLRALARTFVSSVEGFAWTSSILFDPASASDDEQPLQRTTERLVNLANGWSVKYGTGKTVALSPRDRDLYVRVERRRDRLIHPRSVKELKMSLEDLDDLMKAQDWFSRVTELAYFDEDKLAPLEIRKRTR